MKKSASKGKGKNRITLFILAALLLALSATFAGAYTGTDTLISNLFDNVNSFLSSGYEQYQVVIDFIVLFSFFTAASLIGLKKWYGEANRQIVVLAATFGAMMTLALIFGANFSILYLMPFAKGFLFFVLTIIIYLLLLKMGMENHKFMAFLLAALLTFAFFQWLPQLVGGKGLFEGAGTSISSALHLGGGHAKTTKNPATTKTGAKNSAKKGGGSILEKAKDKVTGIFGKNKNECTLTRTDSFGYGEAKLKGGESDEILNFADGCTGPITIYAYTSDDGENMKLTNLAELRASTISGILKSAGYKIKKSLAIGKTWRFTESYEAPPYSVDGREVSNIQQLRSIALEKLSAGEEIPPDLSRLASLNRAYVLSCKCEKGGGAGEKPEGGSVGGPPPCAELISTNLKSLSYRAKKTSERLKTGTPLPITDYQEKLIACRNAAMENPDMYSEYYFDALIAYREIRMRKYFDMGEIKKSGAEVDGVYEEILKYGKEVNMDTGGVANKSRQKILNDFYRLMVINCFSNWDKNEYHGRIKKLGKEGLIRYGKLLIEMDKEVEKAMSEKENGKTIPDADGFRCE